jgi:CMP-N-acetylneuraminic acid synthetase
MSKYLAIIPARAGSKRLPNKNMLELEGKPLVAWSIEAALNSRYIDKVLVTSDDQNILNLSKKYKVDAVNRPKRLSSDTSTTYDVVEHALSLQEEGFEYVVLLQPTSPLRTEKHIDEAVKLLEIKNADAVISVCEVEHPVQWSMSLSDNKDMSEFIKKIDTKRSQELEKNYRLNGAIYICNMKKLLENKTFFLESNIFAYVMSREDSVDIDEEIDFKLAELIVKSKIE